VLITANDVIHAWWVPDFGIKKDAIPGYINEMWFAPTSRACTAASARTVRRDHGFMPVVVEVKTQAEFDAWLEAQKAARQASATPRRRPPPSSPGQSAGGRPGRQRGVRAP